MTQAIHEVAPDEVAARKAPRRAAKPRPSVLEKLTPEELQTLRLDDSARAEFDECVQRFNRSRAELKAFEGDDAATMDDVRYDQRSVAEAEQHSNGMAVVHFMAPRILRLREGAAKRKWRSFLTKFRKDEQLN